MEGSATVCVSDIIYVKHDATCQLCVEYDKCAGYQVDKEEQSRLADILGLTFLPCFDAACRHCKTRCVELPIRVDTLKDAEAYSKYLLDYQDDLK